MIQPVLMTCAINCLLSVSPLSQMLREGRNWVCRIHCHIPSAQHCSWLIQALSRNVLNDTWLQSEEWIQGERAGILLVTHCPFQSHKSNCYGYYYL